jgi:hypothetical protein
MSSTQQYTCHIVNAHERAILGKNRTALGTACANRGNVDSETVVGQMPESREAGKRHWHATCFEVAMNSARLARTALGSLLVFAGISHLTFARRAFRAQVPDWVPLKRDQTRPRFGRRRDSAGGEPLARRSDASGARWQNRRGVFRRSVSGQSLAIHQPSQRVWSGHGRETVRALVPPTGAHLLGAKKHADRGGPDVISITVSWWLG